MLSGTKSIFSLLVDYRLRMWFPIWNGMSKTVTTCYNIMSHCHNQAGRVNEANRWCSVYVWFLREKEAASVMGDPAEDRERLTSQQALCVPDQKTSKPACCSTLKVTKGTVQNKNRKRVNKCWRSGGHSRKQVMQHNQVS